MSRRLLTWLFFRFNRQWLRLLVDDYRLRQVGGSVVIVLQWSVVWLFYLLSRLHLSVVAVKKCNYRLRLGGVFKIIVVCGLGISRCITAQR